MTDTPEAVRLADQIHAGNGEWMQKAAALLRRIPGLEADYQRLMDKHNALHINALASRQRVAKLEAEVLEQARLNGIGAERELALMAQVSRLEAELDQLRAELEKVRWQPVETAPKDGIEVFVYVAGDSVFPTAASYKSSAYFEKEYGDPEYMAEGWYWSFGYPSDFHEDVISPTHWMPLPAAPTPPNADQKGQ